MKVFGQRSEYRWKPFNKGLSSCFKNWEEKYNIQYSVVKRHSFKCNLNLHVNQQWTSQTKAHIKSREYFFLNTGLGIEQHVSLSITLQQCSCEGVYKFYDEIPSSANHSVNRDFVCAHEVATPHSYRYMG